MKRSLRPVLVGTALLSTWFQAAGHLQAADLKNLVANGDFAQIENGKPVRWEPAGDANVTQRLEAISEDGNPCARLVCTRCEPKTAASHAMLAQIGVVRLDRGKVYELSLRARAEGLAGCTLYFAINDMQTWMPCGLHAGLAVGSSWQEFGRVFRATCSIDKNSRLQFWFTEPGTLYLDDVQIVEAKPQEIEFTNAVPPTGARNLVPNGSFELGASGWSSLGQKTGWGGLASPHGRIMPSGGIHGESFLRIPLGGEDTPVLYFDYLRPTVHRELQPLAASLGWIPVKPGTPYTISCDMRASTDGVPAILGVRSQDPEAEKRDYWHKVVLSSSWKRHAFTFRPSHRYAFITVGPSLIEEKQVHVDIDVIQLEEGEQATPFGPRSPLEVAVEPSEAAGIFEQEEKASLRLRARNYSPMPVDLHVDFEVRDFFDRLTELPSESLTVPAASAVERAIDLPPDWKGYYRIQTRHKAGETGGSQTLRVAIIPHQRHEDSVLGVNHAFATPYLIRLARKAGVTWYRDWTLKWRDIEPSPGVLHWEVGDAQLGRVLDQGVHVLPLLPPFPSADWASEAPAGLPTEGYPAVRLREAWAPRDPEKLGCFVASAVERYKDRIRTWEFLNEPILSNYALPGEGIKEYPGKRYMPADYVNLLAVAASAMRRGDPGCQVIGGIAGPPGALTREVIEAGCLKHVDILNVHCYLGTGRPETLIPEMDTLLSLMERHGGRKPIWVTEFAYYATDDLPCRPFFPEKWSWASLLDDERKCAEYTVRFFTIMLGRGVTKVFLHAGSNESANEWGFECPLFAYGGVPRKVYPALAVFTNLMGPKPVFVGESSFDKDGHCFAFETGDRAVLVLWRENECVAETVTVPAAGVECLDIMGNTIAARSIPLATSPVYMLGAAGRAKELLNSLARVAPR